MSEVVLNCFRTRMLEWGGGEGGGAADDARTLLCLHPLGQEASHFEDLAPALGPGWRVVAYDQRGHGVAADRTIESFAQLVDDAEAALRETGARHVAGFSMGGSVAADLAARAALDALILAATPHRGLPVFTERACAAREGGIAAVETPTIERWFGRSGGEPAIERARASLRKMTPEGFDAAWRAFATVEGYEACAAALPPTLCLAYADDLSTPPAVLDEIAGTIRSAGGTATRETIEGAGHMGLLQRPAETAAAIRRHVEVHA